MKSYIVDRSGLTPHLNEMPTNVEKIYPTKADAEAALANGDIADGEFVSTVDTVADTGDKFDKSYLSYSTEETLTGGTWIDGKPIYRKVIASGGQVIPSGSIDLSSLNIDTIVEWHTSIGDNLGKFPWATINNNVYCYLSTSSKLVVYTSFYAYNLAIDYTKTTD